MPNLTPVEITIRLNKFKPRDYQLPIIRALEGGFKKLLVVLPRRSGKDFVALNLMLRQALKRVGTYFYILPKFSSGRRIIWDNITIDGSRLLEFIPEEVIESKNEQQMRIRLLNGSVIQIIGSDKYDSSIVGTNPIGLVYSEFALTNPQSYYLVRPILNANGGWVCLLSTPRGHNAFYDLLQIANQNPKEWFSYIKTIEDTKHISIEQIQHEIETGEMSPDLARQEYWCDFDCGQVGSYYGDYLDKLHAKDRITTVPYEPGFPVHTAWDLGVNDPTCIIFFQVIGTSIRIIDCYSNINVGLDHYAKILTQKDYNYGRHIAPHDIKVREWGVGAAMSRIETARNLGIKFSVSPSLSVEDGIEAVKITFPRLWIDSEKCQPLLKALYEYRRIYDEERKVYHEKPLHNWASNYADAMRYLAISLPKLRDGLTAEDIEKTRHEALYGDEGKLPSFFR